MEKVLRQRITKPVLSGFPLMLLDGTSSSDQLKRGTEEKSGSSWCLKNQQQQW